MHPLTITLDLKVLILLYKSWKQGARFSFRCCLRFLKTKGWLNFRMRAMITSFASYQLWLDWKITSKFLANNFTDYEPGIHYPQIQMQSGTTGINTLNIMLLNNHMIKIPMEFY